jgi:hypothetical protein
VPLDHGDVMPELTQQERVDLAYRAVPDLHDVEDVVSSR